jgi:hypothetical protein
MHYAVIRAEATYSRVTFLLILFMLDFPLICFVAHAVANKSNCFTD